MTWSETMGDANTGGGDSDAIPLLSCSPLRRARSGVANAPPSVDVAADVAAVAGGATTAVVEGLWMLTCVGCTRRWRGGGERRRSGTRSAVERALDCIFELRALLGAALPALALLRPAPGAPGGTPGSFRLLECPPRLRRTPRCGEGGFCCCCCFCCCCSSVETEALRLDCAVESWDGARAEVVGVGVLGVGELSLVSWLWSSWDGAK